MNTAKPVSSYGRLLPASMMDACGGVCLLAVGLLLIVLGYRYPSVSMTLTERAIIRLNDGYLTCVEYGQHTQNAGSVQDWAIGKPES
jgi:hypothetical protein